MLWFGKKSKESNATSPVGGNSAASAIFTPAHSAPIVILSSDEDAIYNMLERHLGGTLRPSDIRKFFDARKSRSLAESTVHPSMQGVRYWIGNDGVTEVFTDNTHRFNVYVTSKTSLMIPRKNFAGAVWADYNHNTAEIEFTAFGMNENDFSGFAYKPGSLKKRAIYVGKIGDAFRCYLGVGCPEDHVMAKKITNELRNLPEVPSAIKGWSVKLQQLISNEQSLALAGIDRDHLAAASTIVRKLCEQSISFEEVKQKIAMDHLSITSALAGRLWAATMLLIHTSPNSSQWREYSQNCMLFTQYVEAALFNITPVELAHSTHDFGPFYNRKNSEGYPIPGSLGNLGTDMPSEGFGRFLGLQGLRSGEIDFRFEDKTKSLVFITQDDIDVILVLAFSDKNPIWPTLSLDDFGSGLLSQKVWCPEWIGHTALGSTFYATDYWMGKLSWKSEGFTVELNHVPSMFKKAANALLGNIIARDQNYMYKHRYLAPLEIQWTWAKAPTGDLQCRIKNISMRIHGGEVITNPDGSTDRYQRMNDSSTQDGRVANMLTEHFDDIAMLWPMFERHRQLTGLLYAVTELRNRGFKLNAALEKRVKSIKDFYTSQPSPALKDRLTLTVA